MIPLLFNENRFSFFVADHLLVAQLCTNPKSDRSPLSCLKVTQCSTSEIRDAPLYNSCSLLIQERQGNSCKYCYFILIILFNIIHSFAHSQMVASIAINVSTSIYQEILIISSLLCGFN